MKDFQSQQGATPLDPDELEGLKIGQQEPYLSPLRITPYFGR